MNESASVNRPAAAGGLAAPVVSQRRRISIVWLVPVIAALIAAWLVYVTISEKGPHITVSFKTASGLEAGKTKVKFRDVEIGRVDSVSISDDNRSVIVAIDLDKSAEKYLTETTKFWVVTARLDASGVSGLGTVLSGSYIELEPGQPGKAEKSYVGLETPPVVSVDSPGRRYVLRSPTASSLGPRTPIYFRGIRVGEVLGYELTKENRIEAFIFVREPYDKLVLPQSNFWNVGGIQVTAGSDGFKVKIESLQTLIAGGLEFDSPSGSPEMEPADEGAVFTLYESQDAIGEATIVERIPYVLHFDADVRGLNPGAPVEFRGVRVGTVSRILPRFNLQTNSVRISVFIDIEPQRFESSSEITGNVNQKRYLLMAALVEKGLRAQMETASLITGQQLISLDFYPDLPKQSLIQSDEGHEIPTVPSEMSEITTSVSQVLDKIEKLPLDILVQDLRGAIGTLDETLKEARILVTSVRGDVNPMMRDFQKAAVSARTTLEQAQATMASIDNSVGESSEVRSTLALMLRELSDASRSIRQLADYLERNPDALIKGKSGN